MRVDLQVTALKYNNIISHDQINIKVFTTFYPQTSIHFFFGAFKLPDSDFLYGIDWWCPQTLSFGRDLVGTPKD